MEKETLYRKVSVVERLPEINKDVFVIADRKKNTITAWYDGWQWYSSQAEDEEDIVILFWLEEIPSQESGDAEKFLHDNKKYMYNPVDGEKFITIDEARTYAQMKVAEEGKKIDDDKFEFVEWVDKLQPTERFEYHKSHPIKTKISIEILYQKFLNQNSKK